MKPHRFNPHAAEFSPSGSFDDLRSGSSSRLTPRPSFESAFSDPTPRESFESSARTNHPLPEDPFGEVISEQVSLRKRHSLEALLEQYKLPDDPFGMGPATTQGSKLSVAARLAAQGECAKPTPQPSAKDSQQTPNTQAAHKVILVTRHNIKRPASGGQS